MCIRDSLLHNTVKFKNLNNETSLKEIAKLSSPFLPLHSYRLQHPRYLRKSKKWSNVELVLENTRSARNNK